MMPLGWSGSVQEAFNEEKLMTSRTGGRTPPGTGEREHVS